MHFVYYSLDRGVMTDLTEAVEFDKNAIYALQVCFYFVALRCCFYNVSTML